MAFICDYCARYNETQLAEFVAELGHRGHRAACSTHAGNMLLEGLKTTNRLSVVMADPSQSEVPFPPA